MGEEEYVAELERFFKPRSVAVIGASATPSKIGFEVLRSLSQYEYKGKVYPITPREGEILGLKCYSSILEVAGPVDLVVFTLQSKLIPPLIDECGKKGVKNVVIISGGFKEGGEGPHRN